MKCSSHCSVDGCSSEVFVKARGLCRLHYGRWWNGKPFHKAVRDDAAVFNSRIKKGGVTDCWPYIGGKDKDGYGIFNYQGRSVRAHRLVLKLRNADLKPGSMICHKCDNPPCCNPNHLFIGNAFVNSLDMMKKGRWGGSPTTKIGSEEAASIRAQYSGKYGEIRRLAKAHRVSNATMWRVVHGWKLTNAARKARSLKEAT